MGKKILIFGDICPDNSYRKLFDNGECVLSEAIQAEIQKAEYVIANLECPATYSTKKIKKCGPNLRAKPEDIKTLAKAGINALSLANNHILDYGTNAVSITLELCKKEGISCFGAGNNQAEANKPLIVKKNGRKIGFISFAEEEFNIATKNEPGAALFDPFDSLDRIQNLKKEVDKVIVLYHGGIEHYIYPTPLLQKKCHKMAKAGADVILCQHSHCIGTIENYENCFIMYGQGNSIFGYRNGEREWNEGLLVYLDMDTFEVQFKVMNATAKGVDFINTKDNKQRVEQIWTNSENLRNQEIIKEKWLEFVAEKKSLYYSLLYGKNRIFNKINRIMGNRLVDIFYSKKTQMITMNILRCDAHREVLVTMLEEKVYDE